MSRPTFSSPCILFALRRESEAFCRPCQRLCCTGAPCPAWWCEFTGLRVLVLETGVGQGHTKTALEWILRPSSAQGVPSRPSVILAAGFAGALHEAYSEGDVLVATDVIDPEGNRWPATWPGELPLGGDCPPLHRGRLLTMPKLVATPQQKRALAAQYDAVAVDMESAAIARLCQQADVPFGCVRSISDSVHTAISPRLLSLLAGGQVSPLRLLAAFLRSPQLVGDVWRLARSTRGAADQLAKALRALLRQTLPMSVT